MWVSNFVEPTSLTVDCFRRKASILHRQDTSNTTICTRAFSLGILEEVRHMSLVTGTEASDIEETFTVSQGSAVCRGPEAECSLGYYGTQGEIECGEIQEANLGTFLVWTCFVICLEFRRSTFWVEYETCRSGSEQWSPTLGHVHCFPRACHWRGPDGECAPDLGYYGTYGEIECDLSQDVSLCVFNYDVFRISFASCRSIF